MTLPEYNGRTPDGPNITVATREREVYRQHNLHQPPFKRGPDLKNDYDMGAGTIGRETEMRFN